MKPLPFLFSILALAVCVMVAQLIFLYTGIPHELSLILLVLHKQVYDEMEGK